MKWYTKKGGKNMPRVPESAITALDHFEGWKEIPLDTSKLAVDCEGANEGKWRSSQKWPCEIEENGHEDKNDELYELYH